MFIRGNVSASLFVIGDLLGCVIGGPIADRSVFTLLDRGCYHYHDMIMMISVTNAIMIIIIF